VFILVGVKKTWLPVSVLVVVVVVLAAVTFCCTVAQWNAVSVSVVCTTQMEGAALHLSL
jgi:hypothetical protein